VLDSLVTKAKESDSNTWKWVLGICIVLLVVAAGIWIAWMRSRIARLEAEKALLDERAKDMAVHAANEKDEQTAKALMLEAVRLRDEAAAVDTRLRARKAELEEAERRVKDAKSWDDLEREAGGE
jgi:flagellar biosynthesis/type III secretory pathway M-ring protein FliF/YscJ